MISSVLSKNFMRNTRTLSTFVSRHNAIKESDVRDFLDNVTGIELRETRDHFIIKDCTVMPNGFCLNPNGLDKADNQWKAYMKRGADGGAGTWFCHRCGSKGSWYDLKQLSNGIEISHSFSAIDSTKSASTQQKRMRPELKLPNQKLVGRYPVTLSVNPGGLKEVTQIQEYLTGSDEGQRGIDMHVLVKYGVGCAMYRFPDGNKYVEATCVTFPWVMSLADLENQDRDLNTASPTIELGEAGSWVTRRIKARAWQNKSWQRLDPPGGGWGLFGLHTVPATCKEVVLTEGEYDAMAVYQGTGMAAVSLPNGASSLPIDVLPLLEKFDRIYLWMDDDAPGQDAMEKFAKKLGMARCYLVKPLKKDIEKLEQEGKTLKDANDALRLGVDMKAMIDDARPLDHQQITSFRNMRQQVLHELRHSDDYKGTMIRSLPNFSGIVKGLRKGEVSLITGATGSGKTTLLSQISLDCAQQGVNTLWGSFEVKNNQLMKKMMQQFHGKPLVQEGEVISGIEAIADRFQSLPLSFMTFHGGSEIDQVIDAMDYAVYAHDMQFAIVDNLQFMLSRVGRGKSGFSDRFDQQDMAVEKFRRFATDKNVHVTLVVHPRKEDENVRLGLSSIFGGAKATQEADLIVILQTDGDMKYLDVRKNRFDGELGIVPMAFSQQTASFYEDPDQLSAVKQRLSSKSNFGFRSSTK